MLRVFVSYRRQDSGGHTGRLFDRVVQRFGRDQVFLDVDGIRPGTNFVAALEAAITSCDIVIAVIGRSWLDAADEAGQRRLDQPQDFVRTELTTALREGITVLPVLVQDARPPPRDALPDELAPLADLQAFELRDSRWDDDVQRLLEALGPGLGRRRLARAIVAVSAALAVGAFAWWAPAPGAAHTGAASEERAVPAAPVPQAQVEAPAEPQPRASMEVEGAAERPRSVDLAEEVRRLRLEDRLDSMQLVMKATPKKQLRYHAEYEALRDRVRSATTRAQLEGAAEDLSDLELDFWR